MILLIMIIAQYVRMNMTDNGVVIVVKINQNGSQTINLWK